MKLPAEFLQRMQELFARQGMGEEWPAFLASFDQTPARAFRMNELKLRDFAAFRNFRDQLPGGPAEADRVPWSRDGLYLPPDARPAKTAAYRAGLFYIQEASAMLPAEAADIRPGMRVIDLCAAPGGKSLRAAAKLNGEGLLWSNDLSASRAKALMRNLEQCGVANAIVSAADPARLAEAMPGCFDRILIDAPCSGEGMFRRDPAAVRAWSTHGTERIADVQSSILDSAARLAAPGAEIVYSTCTYNPAENEEQILAFVARHPEFEISDSVALPESADCLSRGLDPYEGTGEADRATASAEIRKAYRIWPHHVSGDGHFCCVLRRRRAESELQEQDEAHVQDEDQRLRTSEPASSVAPAFGTANNKNRHQKRRKNPDRPANGRNSTINPEYDLHQARNAFIAAARSLLTDPCVKALEQLPPNCFRLHNGQVHIIPAQAISLLQSSLAGVKLLKTGCFAAELRPVKNELRAELTHAFILSLKEENFRAPFFLDSTDPRLAAYLRGETLLPTPEEIEAHAADTLIPVLLRTANLPGAHPIGRLKPQGEVFKNLFPPGWRD